MHRTKKTNHKLKAKAEAKPKVESIDFEDTAVIDPVPTAIPAPGPEDETDVANEVLDELDVVLPSDNIKQAELVEPREFKEPAESKKPIAPTETPKLPVIEESKEDLDEDSKQVPETTESPDVCPSCKERYCVNGYLCSSEVPSQRYTRMPPYPGFDIVIKVREVSGEIVRYNFSRYCLSRLRYFRVMLAAGMREERSGEIDLSSFQADVVFPLLVYLDPFCDHSVSFYPQGASHARRLIAFMHLLEIGKEHMEQCVFSICAAPQGTDMAILFDIGMERHVESLLDGLDAHGRSLGQPREWYINLIANPKLSLKHKKRLMRNFESSGHVTSPEEAALFNSMLTGLKAKLRMMYLAAGDKNLVRAIMADIGLKASICTIDLPALSHCFASMPAMIRKMRDDNWIDAIPSILVPTVSMAKNEDDFE